MLEFLIFEIWIFQTTLDGETTKIKVVDLKKLYKFIVNDFLIWVCIETQTLILNSVVRNMNRKNI